jgi:two-component system, NarL family, response regulator LiaR
MAAVSLGYQIVSGVLCHLDEVLRQPPGRQFPPPEDTPLGVDLYPRLGPGLLSRRRGRPLVFDVVDVGSSSADGSSPSQTITVVTVDGDPLARRALRVQLAPEPDLELVGEATDPSAGVDLVSEQQPDLALVAVTARDRHSSDRIGEMFKASPRTHIIVLTIERDEDAQMQFLRAGAAGCLIKSVDLEVLPRVLRGVHAGEAAVPRAMCKRVVREAIGPGRIDRNRLRPVRSSLTGREWEVVDLLVEGATTEGIAGELQLSPATIRTHVKHILGKLGVHSRDEAVRHVERVRHEGADPRPGLGRSAALPKNHTPLPKNHG